METYNELNKFLSYIHMGNETFRIYYDKACEINSKRLKDLIVQIQEVFKTHEELITSILKRHNAECSDDLTMVGKMAVLMEKVKVTDEEFDICERAIKAVNMGLISGLKFAYYNKNMESEIKEAIKDVIADYTDITEKINDFILERCC